MFGLGIKTEVGRRQIGRASCIQEDGLGYVVGSLRGDCNLLLSFI